jgi:hypothetical protein
LSWIKPAAGEADHLSQAIGDRRAPMQADGNSAVEAFATADAVRGLA